MEPMTLDEQAEFDAARAEVRALIRKLDPDDAVQRKEIGAEAKEVFTRLPRKDLQELLKTEFLKAYVRVEAGEPPFPTEWPLCACGCGWPVPGSPSGAKYATRVCIERAQRRDTQTYREHAAADEGQGQDLEEDPDCE
jgi:hypothetical protein